MKKAALFVVFFALNSALYSQDTYVLSIHIKGIQSNIGYVQVGLYNSKSTFPKVGMEYRVARVAAHSSETTVVFEQLPEGEYAFAVFHDENNDLKCNTNLVGYPTEGFAFSNDVRPFLSAPGFNKAKFRLSQSTELSVQMEY